MSKLKKLKEKEKKRKVIYLLIGIFVVLLNFLIEKTYAIYQQEDEVTFINAKVRFPTSNEISYTITNNKNITNVEEALNDLYGKLGK